MRVATIKSSIAAAAMTMVAFMPTMAHAGAQADTHSLTDILVAKGILTKDEAKAVSHNRDNKLSFGATIFADFTNNETSNNGAGWAAASQGTQTKKTGANLTRAYLTGKYIINDTWLARVTTDVSTENAYVASTSGGATTSNLSKRNQIYLKYAYLEGDFMPELSLRFGVIHTAWIDHNESLWQHRYVSHTMVDKLGDESSADAGIGIVGKTMGGLINYQVDVVNGGGYGNTTPTNKQDLSARLGIDPLPGLTIDLGYREGYKGKSSFAAGASNIGTATGPVGKQHLMQAMVTYGSGHDYRIGVNYLQDKDKHDIAANDKKTDAYGVWGYYNFADTSVGKLGVFGRYWHAKLTPYNNGSFTLTATQTAETKKNEVIGLELKPTKKVALSLVYKNLDTKNSGYVTDKNTKDRTFGLYGLVDF